MKIAVIGANGKTGRVFVKAALDAGHDVVAGFHRKNNLKPSARLTVQSCDTASTNEIIQLINGCDVVVSLIGHGRRSPARLQTEAMHSLAAAMDKLKMKRLISLTGDGVREPGDKVNIIDTLGNTAIKLVDPKRISDGVEHARFLQQSDLDYTIIRVFKLTNGPLRPFRLKEHGPAMILVPRHTVANAILDCIERTAWVRQSPIIGRV